MIVAIVGDNKTCKTTLALTWPKPLYHAEFDIGGFERASGRFTAEIDRKEIVSVQYAFPSQYIKDKLLGKQGVSIKVVSRLTGVKELWYRFIADTTGIIESKRFASVVIDSFPQMWEVCHGAYLQEKQEAQLDAKGNLSTNQRVLRERLQPEEYSEPNKRVRELIYAFRMGRVNLLLPIFITDRREKRLVAQSDGSQKVEEIIVGTMPAGWNEKHLIKEVDLAIATSVRRTELKKGEVSYKPVVTVQASGLGLELIEAEIDPPSYQGLMSTRELLCG